MIAERALLQYAYIWLTTLLIRKLLIGGMKKNEKCNHGEALTSDKILDCIDDSEGKEREMLRILCPANKKSFLHSIWSACCELF